jgi:serine/threonine protein kinase
MKRKLVPRALVVLTSHFTVLPSEAPKARSRTLALERDGRRFFGKVVSKHERADQYDVLHELWCAMEGRPEQAYLPRPEGLFALGSTDCVVVTEYAPGTDLFEYTVREKENGAAAASERVLRDVFACILRVLGAMHELGFVHGDIKPENVMVDIAGDDVRRVCLVDFGFCFRVASPPKFPRMGTVIYVAPEMLCGTDDRYSPALDAYAAGATLLTLFTRKNPFLEPQFNEARSIRLVVDFDAAKLGVATAKCPPALAALIAQLMAPRPARISVADALASEWLTRAASPRRTWRRPLDTLGTCGSAVATS